MQPTLVADFNFVDLRNVVRPIHCLWADTIAAPSQPCLRMKHGIEKSAIDATESTPPEDDFKKFTQREPNAVSTNTLALATERQTWQHRSKNKW